jgi:transcriptional regulator with XRE-family HTH domain
VKSVADRIQWILDQRGISQRELARRSGLKGAHIGVIISRSRRNPGANIENDTLAAIARGGEVALRWLATGQGSPDPSAEESGARPVLGNLPGWTEAEQHVRRILKGTPEWVFQCARSVAGLHAPREADAELVMRVVLLCRDYPPPSRKGDGGELAATGALAAAITGTERARRTRSAPRAP